MNIKFTSILQGPNGEWIFAWASTGASYYRIILSGHEIETTADTTYTYHLPNYKGTAAPPLEVVATTSLAVSEKDPPYITLQWYGVVGAAYYQIEQFVSGSWGYLNSITSDDQFMYTADTPISADGADVSYRILAVNEAGARSSPLVFTYKVVRPPNPPLVTHDYDPATQTVIIGN